MHIVPEHCQVYSMSTSEICILSPPKYKVQENLQVKRPKSIIRQRLFSSGKRAKFFQSLANHKIVGLYQYWLNCFIFFHWWNHGVPWKTKHKSKDTHLHDDLDQRTREWWKCFELFQTWILEIPKVKTYQIFWVLCDHITYHNSFNRIPKSRSIQKPPYVLATVPHVLAATFPNLVTQIKHSPN